MSDLYFEQGKKRAVLKMIHADWVFLGFFGHIENFMWKAAHVPACDSLLLG